MVYCVLFYRQRKSTVLERPVNIHRRVVSESEIFLRNLRETYPNLPKKIQSAVDKFAARKDFETTVISKIITMRNEKLLMFYTNEEAMLDNAKSNIGDLNLKSSSDFKPSDDKVISMEAKFFKFMNVKDEV